MSHHMSKSGYKNLVNRLNKSPQGAPPSELLYKILKILFSEKEAALVALLPIRLFTAEKASRAWKMDAVSTQKVLDDLCSRAILLDIEQNGRMVYILPPPMAGFFEFSMMRVRGDINQKLLAELFYEYINVEEDFIKSLFGRGETQLGRVFVQESILSNENALYVLDYERASEIIKTASHIAISICYCRHKMEHLGRNCDNPKDICMTFNHTAAALIRHAFARQVDVSEGMDLLQSAYGHNLVQFGENVREQVNFICNCCGCCCEGMIAARKFAILRPVHTTNFIPEVRLDTCTGCGKCVTACPVEAMALVTANDPHRPKKKKAKLNGQICLGCGICARVCTTGSIFLRSRSQRVITPLNTAHRMVLMAIERDKLQHLIFDNQVLKSHRALAILMGVILKLSPIKRAMAVKQLKSRYLEAMVNHAKWAPMPLQRDQPDRPEWDQTTGKWGHP